jgi:hypothetical protein
MSAAEKHYRVWFEGVRCSHLHPSYTDALGCYNTWLARLKEIDPPFRAFDPKHFVIRRNVIPSKEPIWCSQCKKMVPRVRWHGHYERNHGINSPKRKPHSSHRMTKWETEIRSPTGGEPRFYSVRRCRKCGLEELSHPAGHFNAGLREVCGSAIDIVHYG